jgi:aryl-alcohol dehydrogenase-like predicted oxidoreductase
MPDVEPALDESLKKLGTDYLDLYIIHWPVAFKKGSNNVLDEELTADPYPTWQALEAMVAKGKVRRPARDRFAPSLTLRPAAHDARSATSACPTSTSPACKT